MRGMGRESSHHCRTAELGMDPATVREGPPLHMGEAWFPIPEPDANACLSPDFQFDGDCRDETQHQLFENF